MLKACPRRCCTCGDRPSLASSYTIPLVPLHANSGLEAAGIHLDANGCRQGITRSFGGLASAGRRGEESPVRQDAVFGEDRRKWCLFSLIAQPDGCPAFEERQDLQIVLKYRAKQAWPLTTRSIQFGSRSSICPRPCVDKCIL